MRTLNRYSIGIGDRFSHQAQAQLKALSKASESGVNISPVWNKSYREHSIIDSQPSETRLQADKAVRELSWQDDYFVDADHVGLKTVDFFLESSDFFTLDVADYITEKTDTKDIDAFVEANIKYTQLNIPGISDEINISEKEIRAIAEKYLLAVQEAGRIYRHIIASKNKDDLIIEVSMDETDSPQTPVEIFFILSAIAGEKIPVQTIAPKFSGRFNKGVDYVGDLDLFEKEFSHDLAVIRYCIREFKLPESLKLSVHSGSDKFSIYPIMKKAIRENDAGLHLKTAGTTWLEELIGLAEGGEEGLQMAKEIYAESLLNYDELCEPYATVIDIDKNKLPSAKDVAGWGGEKYAKTLRHVQSEESYNPHFRQLLHVGYKIAAQKGRAYTTLLEQYEASIERNVIENIYDRHIQRIFI